MDPTLRSVFNPAPLAIHGYGHSTAWRRNKPSFGLVFTQLLDIHLLCTKVPRERQDAERLFAPLHGPDSAAAGEVLMEMDTPGYGPDTGVSPIRTMAGAASTHHDVRYAWVVECLLDEIGIWDGPGMKRRSREQRWGAVDVRAGRIVDAFEKRARVYGELRVAGGFGGLRV
jgi:hypothetical protein